ncbi:hypothetical protein D3C72_1457040 [compost metagenome]
MPTPDDAYVSVSGLARASAISSSMLFTGRPGRASSTTGAVVTTATGVRSFSASYFTAELISRATLMGPSNPITSV